MPIKELKYFKKITISKGASINTNIAIPVNELQKWDLSKNKWALYPGKYKLVFGSNAKDEKITSSFEVQ
jgi:beta-glucosidase